MTDDAYEVRFSWTLTIQSSMVNVLVPKFFRVHPMELVMDAADLPA